MQPANSISTPVARGQRGAPRIGAAIALVLAFGLAGCNVTVPKLAQSTAD